MNSIIYTYKLNMFKISFDFIAKVAGIYWVTFILVFLIFYVSKYAWIMEGNEIFLLCSLNILLVKKLHEEMSFLSKTAYKIIYFFLFIIFPKMYILFVFNVSKFG